MPSQMHRNPTIPRSEWDQGGSGMGSMTAIAKSGVEPTRFYSQALFLHDQHLFQRLPEEVCLDVEEKISGLSTQMERNAYRRVCAESVATRIFESRPEELAVWLMEDRAVGDSAVLTTTQRFYFRKASKERGAFRAKFSVNQGISLEGRFSYARCVGDTGLDLLSGSRRVTILGHFHVIEASPTLKIEIMPLFIGNIVERAISEDAPVWDFSGRRQIYAMEIDQFKKVQGALRPSAKMMTDLAAIPEETVKNYFAEILGEPYVGKDWGGENSDLHTNRLTVDGKQVNASFAFKGPGQKGKLTVARMGKNGDQGLRLFNESIDIAVVQHYREVDAAVTNLMEALARQYGAKFLILDGMTTAQIFHAYGYLPGPAPETGVDGDDSEF